MSTLPPDLSNCTRLEIHYPDEAIGHFFPSSAIEKSIFSADEREYIRSFGTWVVNDPELIRAFAHDINQGTYAGELRGTPKSRGVNVVCWHGNDRAASLTVYGALVVADDRHTFKYKVGSPDLAILAPPSILPLQLRFTCALNLGKLYVAGPLLRREVSSYPEANQWCDAIVEALRKRYFTYEGRGDGKKRSYPDVVIAGMFMCPSLHWSSSPADSHRLHDPNLPDQPVRSWRSDYAMNPNCKRDSPSDTVILFETKAGWNQHGGPELFTFDNHDPRGGLVLLNDGTVQFIRTEEELKQLRWK